MSDPLPTSPGDALRRRSEPGFVFAADAPLAIFADHWLFLALRGLCAIVFGVLAIVVPGITLASLVFLFAAYALLDGFLAVGSAIIAARRDHQWTALAAEGVLDLIVALFLIAMPAVSIIVTMYVTAFWAILSGAALAMASFRLHAGRWLMLLAAVTSILLGAVLLSAPLQGALVLAMWLGIYATLFGVMLLGLAFQLRRVSRAMRNQEG